MSNPNPIISNCLFYEKDGLYTFKFEEDVTTDMKQVDLLLTHTESYTLSKALEEGRKIPRGVTPFQLHRKDEHTIQCRAVSNNCWWMEWSLWGVLQDDLLSEKCRLHFLTDRRRNSYGVFQPVHTVHLLDYWRHKLDLEGFLDAYLPAIASRVYMITEDIAFDFNEAARGHNQWHVRLLKEGKLITKETV